MTHEYTRHTPIALFAHTNNSVSVYLHVLNVVHCTRAQGVVALLDNRAEDGGQGRAGPGGGGERG